MQRGKSRTVIWNTASRHLLYSNLKAKFGVFHTWKSKYPDGINEFLDEYAKRIGAASPQAVWHQIRYVLAPCSLREGFHDWDQCLGRTGIGNLVAALEAGFIRQRDLPNFRVLPGSRKSTDTEPDLWEHAASVESGKAGTVYMKGDSDG